MIEAVGKPVLKGSMDDYYGSWMHDAFSRYPHDVMSDKLFVTRNNTHDMSYIYEFKSKEHFKKNDTGFPIKLPHPFQVGSLKIQKRKKQQTSNIHTISEDLQKYKKMITRLECKF